MKTLNANLTVSVVILIALFFSAPTVLSSENPVVIELDHRYRKIDLLQDKGLLIYSGKHAQLNLGEILLSPQWKAIPVPFSAPGFTKEPIWFRFSYKNKEKIPLIYLELGSYMIDFMDVYHVKNNNIVSHETLGDTVRLSERQIKNRRFIVKIPMFDEADIYVKYQAEDALDISMKIWNPSDFHSNSINENLYQGLYFGVVIIFAIINFLFFTKSFSKKYLWYAVFQMTLFLYVFCSLGYASYYLWPEFPFLNNVVIAAMIPIVAACRIQFTSVLFDFKNTHPKYEKIFRRMCYTLGLFAVLNLFFDTPTIFMVMVWVTMTCIIISLVASYSLFFQGVAWAGYVCVAWLILDLVTFYLSLQKSGIVPSQDIIYPMFQVASLIEMLFISLAISESEVSKRLKL